MMIFNFLEENNFKIFFFLVGGYNVLDGIMGKGWDVKLLRVDVADCYFKFVILFIVYLDKKYFIIKFLFLYFEVFFFMGLDYRDKCKVLFM